MEKEKIIKLAGELVKITIEKHDQKLLGQEKMFIFLKKHIKEEITTSDFDNILHHYSKLLSKEGYEIIKDINHFDIIDYDSNEYQIYIEKSANHYSSVKNIVKQVPSLSISH